MPRFRFAALALSIAACFAGCQKQTDVIRGAHEKVLTMSLSDDAATLDPALVTSSYTNKILQALFEGLVNISNDGKTILPGVAERWEISADGKTYTFHLRSNARWSNGEPLTAHDFVFAFRRVYNPKLGSETAASGFAISGAEASITGRNPDPTNIGVTAPDEHTFVITLAHPAAYFLEALVQSPFYPVQESVVTRFHGNEQRGSAWTRPENMVSNGPFKLKKWIGNQLIEVVKNEQYWDAEHVSLNGIRFLPIEDEMSEEHAFRAGQVHVTSKSPPDKAGSYLADHPGELRLPAFLRSDYLTFNVHRPPFDNPLVRRAFSLAIDRDRLIAAVLPHVASPTQSLTRDGAGGYHPPQSSACQFDPAEAKRLLAQAGYSDVSKLPPIEFMLNGPQGYVLKTGEVLQEMWAKNLGIHVAVLPVEFKIYLDSLRTKQFQVLLDDWIYSWDDALDPLQLCSTGNPNNDAGYSNPQYDKIFRDAENSADRTQREHDFDTLENIVAQEVPYAPLYARLNDHLVSPLVVGWVDNAVDVTNWKEISLREP